MKNPVKRRMRSSVLLQGGIEIDVKLIRKTKSRLIYEITSGYLKGGIIVTDRKWRRDEVKDSRR